MLYGFIANSILRRWVFYIAAIITGILFLLCLPLSESRPSLLLEREVAKIRRTMPSCIFKTSNPDHTPDWNTLIRCTLIRPLRLLFSEPIIILVAIMGAASCSVWYMFADALLITFQGYGWSQAQASLSFIPVSIGCLCGFLPRICDYHKLGLRQRQHQTTTPESVLFGFAIAAPALAIGLWWFAWTVPPVSDIHFMVPMAALVLIGFALNEFTYTLTSYLAESYTMYAASGFAGLLLARSSICAAVLPFTHNMYASLGPNHATTILAGIATTFCVAPWLFFRYGKSIRERSTFAKYSLETYRQQQIDLDVIEIGEEPPTAIAGDFVCTPPCPRFDVERCFWGQDGPRTSIRLDKGSLPDELGVSCSIKEMEQK